MAHKYLEKNQDERESSPLEVSDTIETPALNRPPKSPGPALGPYFQFITTDLENMIWIGSALIFRHVSLDRPKIEFFSEAKIDYNWEVLYENLFDMRAFRINLQVELRAGEGDEKVVWKIDWGDYSTSAIFYIARYNQKWRGGFFTCNGFDDSISKETIADLNYNNLEGEGEGEGGVRIATKTGFDLAKGSLQLAKRIYDLNN